MSHTNSEAIQVLAACGASPKAIAAELGIPEATLIAHHTHDMEIGLELANARVAKTFFDMATSGEHPTLTSKWMELRGGWSSSSSLVLHDQREEAEVAREKLLKLLNRAPPPSKLKAVK